MLARLREAGGKVVLDTKRVFGIRDTVCVALCCRLPGGLWMKLCENGCKLILSPCMTYLQDDQEKTFRELPPTAIHFQSEYQKSKLWDSYHSWGCESGFVIPGAFEIDDFPYAPAKRDSSFVVGKLARPAITKWPRDLWDTIGKVRSGSGVDVRALCMAFGHALRSHVGVPPEWVTSLAANELDSVTFLSRCHVLYCAGQQDTENDPRVGMEAMAVGVPVIADARGGWSESIVSGETGILVNSSTEGIEAMRELAANEQKRLAMAARARVAVAARRDPIRIGGKWREVLESL